jgi:hypothetical protein
MQDQLTPNVLPIQAPIITSTKSNKSVYIIAGVASGLVLVSAIALGLSQLIKPASNTITPTPTPTTAIVSVSVTPIQSEAPKTTSVATTGTEAKMVTSYEKKTDNVTYRLNFASPMKLDSEGDNVGGAVFETMLHADQSPVNLDTPNNCDKTICTLFFTKGYGFMLDWDDKSETISSGSASMDGAGVNDSLLRFEYTMYKYEDIYYVVANNGVVHIDFYIGKGKQDNAIQAVRQVITGSFVEGD